MSEVGNIPGGLNFPGRDKWISWINGNLGEILSFAISNSRRIVAGTRERRWQVEDSTRQAQSIATEHDSRVIYLSYHMSERLTVALTNAVFVTDVRYMSFIIRVIIIFVLASYFLYFSYYLKNVSTEQYFPLDVTQTDIRIWEW